MKQNGVLPDRPMIAPSMLKCDFGNLEREIQKLERAGAKTLHLDVMDGHFVPNLTYGPAVIERIRKITSLTLDAHLMISDPDRYLEDYLRAGCDWITIHIEAVPQPSALLARIRNAGKLAGIAVNPETPMEAVSGCVGQVDLVLVMSVRPGFGGQKFIAGSTEKIRKARQMFGAHTLISVDGGIGPTTVPETAAAGADVFVAGSSIFDRPDYAPAISEMVDLARAAAS